MTTTPADTKTAERRTLVFTSLDDVRRDLDVLERTHGEGALRVTGNWSPGQTLAHLAQVFQYSFDGFPFTAPLALRLIGPLLKKRILRSPITPGLRLRGGSSVLEPKQDVHFEDGMAALRAQLDRIDAGERMTQRSPLLGRMSHDDWLALHRRHAELHLGFLHPAAD